MNFSNIKYYNTDRWLTHSAATEIWNNRGYKPKAEQTPESRRLMYRKLMADTVLTSTDGGVTFDIEHWSWGTKINSDPSRKLRLLTIYPDNQIKIYNIAKRMDPTHGDYYRKCNWTFQKSLQRITELADVGYITFQTGNKGGEALSMHVRHPGSVPMHANLNSPNDITVTKTSRIQTTALTSGASSHHWGRQPNRFSDFVRAAMYTNSNQQSLDRETSQNFHEGSGVLADSIIKHYVLKYCSKLINFSESLNSRTYNDAWICKSGKLTGWDINIVAKDRLELVKDDTRLYLDSDTNIADLPRLSTVQKLNTLSNDSAQFIIGDKHTAGYYNPVINSGLLPIIVSDSQPLSSRRYYLGRTSIRNMFGIKTDHLNTPVVNTHLVRCLSGNFEALVNSLQGAYDVMSVTGHTSTASGSYGRYRRRHDDNTNLALPGADSDHAIKLFYMHMMQSVVSARSSKFGGNHLLPLTQPSGLMVHAILSKAGANPDYSDFILNSYFGESAMKEIKGSSLHWFKHPCLSNFLSEDSDVCKQGRNLMKDLLGLVSGKSIIHHFYPNSLHSELAILSGCGYRATVDGYAYADVIPMLTIEGDWKFYPKAYYSQLNNLYNCFFNVSFVRKWQQHIKKQLRNCRDSVSSKKDLLSKYSTIMYESLRGIRNASQTVQCFSSSIKQNFMTAYSSEVGVNGYDYNIQKEFSVIQLDKQYELRKSCMQELKDSLV